MIWRVLWLQTALDELASGWMQADPDMRQAITAAAHSVDSLLQTDPYNQGESRSYPMRIMFQPPLGLTFEIRQQVEIVRVIHVWIVRQRDQH